MKHYSCNRYFIDHTRTIRISNTAKLLPSHYRMPNISKENNIIIAAEEIMKGISEKLGAEEVFKLKKSSNNSRASSLTSHLKG